MVQVIAVAPAAAADVWIVLLALEFVVAIYGDEASVIIFTMTKIMLMMMSMMMIQLIIIITIVTIIAIHYAPCVPVQLIGLVFIFTYALFGLQFFADRAEVADICNPKRMIHIGW